MVDKSWMEISQKTRRAGPTTLLENNNCQNKTMNINIWCLGLQISTWIELPNWNIHSVMGRQDADWSKHMLPQCDKLCDNMACTRNARKKQDPDNCTDSERQRFQTEYQTEIRVCRKIRTEIRSVARSSWDWLPNLCQYSWSTICLQNETCSP